MTKFTHVFGNPIDAKTQKKALKSKQKFLKKFGDDTSVVYHLDATDNATLTPVWDLKEVKITAGSTPLLSDDKGIVIGNIRMGFGHYRIAMAIASCAIAKGYTPYWFDLNSFSETTGGKVIAHLNGLYSMGSRWSQKYPLFNKFYWEPLNAEGFRKLSYHAVDLRNTQLMTPVFKGLDLDMPFIATHVWPAQAALHAGVKKVVNVIPDNWPMALHLAEGSIHTVQTPSSYVGYKTLNGMQENTVLNPMPQDALYDVGHYIDHELVENIPLDCGNRIKRLQEGKTKRLLMTIGGAGAQKSLYVDMIKTLLPRIQAKEVALYINVGDHMGVWEGMKADLPQLNQKATCHFDDWQATAEFANTALNQEVTGIHAFYHKDIFAAVYSTNLLMRSCDVLITKPSELAFYPVPKLMIKRVGGHEAWGAIRAAEVGDGTIECTSTAQALNMLTIMLNDPTLLTTMNNNILKANQVGTYDGGYKVIDLALSQ